MTDLVKAQRSFPPGPDEDSPVLSGASRPATSLARRLDRLPNGQYVIILDKRSSPGNWTLKILPMNGTATVLER